MAKKTGQSASPTARPRKTAPFGASKLQVPGRSGRSGAKPGAVVKGSGGSTGHGGK